MSGLEIPIIAGLFSTGGAAAAGAGAVAAGGAAAAGAGLASAAGVVSTIGTAASIAGLATSIGGTATTVSAEREMARQSRLAEEARQQQMQLESARKQREIIRNAMIARSNSVTNTTEAGANYSSALPGSLAQYTGQENVGLNTNTRATNISNAIFAANQNYASAQSTASLGKGLTSLGGVLMQQNTTIGKIGSLFTSGDKNNNPYGGQSSFNPTTSWAFGGSASP